MEKSYTDSTEAFNKLLELINFAELDKQVRATDKQRWLWLFSPSFQSRISTLYSELDGLPLQAYEERYQKRSTTLWGRLVTWFTGQNRLLTYFYSEIVRKNLELMSSQKNFSEPEQVQRFAIVIQMLQKLNFPQAMIASLQAPWNSYLALKQAEKAQQEQQQQMSVTPQQVAKVTATPTVTTEPMLPPAQPAAAEVLPTAKEASAVSDTTYSQLLQGEKKLELSQALVAVSPAVEVVATPKITTAPVNGVDWQSRWQQDSARLTKLVKMMQANNKSIDQIKEALRKEFRALSQIYHPDKQQDEQQKAIAEDFQKQLVGFINQIVAKLDKVGNTEELADWLSTLGELGRLIEKLERDNERQLKELQELREKTQAIREGQQVIEAELNQLVLKVKQLEAEEEAKASTCKAAPAVEEESYSTPHP